MNPKNRSVTGRRVTGTVKRHPDGYGFLVPDERGLPDLYIPKHSMEGVMTNDKLQVKVIPDGARFRGEGIEVVSRETKQVIGKLKIKDRTRGFLKDESLGWGEDLKVSWSLETKVKDGDFVLVRITSYPESVRGFQGEVEMVLGDIENPENDNMRVLASHNIPYQFSEEALEEARRLEPEVTAKDMEGRKNLRDKNFITIDGKTAKDFDDAILVQKENAGFRLWVAIADVSHYVKPGTAIDKDAYKRGTSTYFPNFVAPMLPEALSNELCSLKPQVPRLALVAEMSLSHEGGLQASKRVSFMKPLLNHKHV
jgi:ribonuclease R